MAACVLFLFLNPLFFHSIEWLEPLLLRRVFAASGRHRAVRTRFGPRAFSPDSNDRGLRPQREIYSIRTAHPGAKACSRTRLAYPRRRATVGEKTAVAGEKSRL